MKSKSIALIMMLLILVSTLNLTVFAPQLVAEDTVTKALNETFAETPKTNQVNSTYNIVKSSQVTEDSSKQGTEGAAVTQNKPLEDSRQTSQDRGDKWNLWNFNDTSEWSKSAYMDGNKTRLIVGVNGEKHTSFIELEKIAAKHQAKIVNTVSIRGEVSAVVVELLLASVTGFVEETRASELASYIEPNMKVQTQFVPNDPYWSLQWGPKKIEADWAWNTTIGNHSVLVAVVDTGIDYNHPDLAANYAPLGYDWVNNDTDPKDDFGHGTHCAGIIAAVLNNSIGIAGLAQVRVMAEKVLTSSGGGYWDWVANGIIHATDYGANIISMSLGGYGESELLREAVKYAYNAGVLVIAAAGNDNINMKSYPAGYDEVVAVAATDQYDNKAWFSNWGEWIELAAPGVSIYSTMPTYHVTLNDYGYSMNYAYLSGTSMACPHVSGAAALIWSLYPNKTRDWVRLWLRYTADDLGDPGFDVYYGYGRVNARKAVEQTPPTHELIAYEWTTPPYIEPGALGIINATILNFGENNETSVSVHLLANGTLVDSTSIGFLASGNSTTISLAWNPTVEGLYNVTLYVVPVPDELNRENNILWKYIYVGFPVKAVVLHSVGNIYSEIITNWQVLSSEWYLFGDTMVYIDYTTLNKEDISYEDIAATEADVLIISCAYDPSMGWQFTDSEIEAITQYVHEGHGLIATAATFYYLVPNNNKLAPLFGLNETITWYATYTDLLHLLNITHPLFRNVPNPFVFADVDTAIPSDERWDSNELVGGKYLALGHYQESAIVTYRGLVYISPWLEVIPAYYQHHLQLLYNAITWSRYQKPEHELIVSLQCPTHLKPGESVLVNATVQNTGLNNETNVELLLLFDDAQVANLTVPTLAVGELETLSYLWTPTEGTYNVTAYAPPVPSEEETFNNRKTIRLRVSYAAVIGFIETHGETLHSDELKIFYQSLGHIVDTIHSMLTPKLLADYDILIVGEDWYNNPWSSSEIAAVQDFISSGRGFVGIGDELAYPVQEILGGYGITYTGSYGKPGSSSNFDHSHPIMKDVNYIYASNPVNSLQAVPPGYWIANDAYNVHMLIAGAEVGGYVLCMSNDFAAYVYDDDNEIMFINMVKWMVRYEHDLDVTLDAPVFLELGNSTMLNVTVQNRGLNNETDVQLLLLINDTLASSATIPVLLVGESYSINYLWTPTITGNYNITAYAPPVPEEEYIANNIKTKSTYVFFYSRVYLPHQWVGAGVEMGWHADDSSWQYNLPFDFPFYGIYYRTIYISSNGLITFLSPDSSCINSIPDLAGKLAIAPAWDDWVTDDPYDIYIWQNSTHIGIRWYVRHYGTGIVANFEAILCVNGVIQFNYAYNDGPISATIGISNGKAHILAEDVGDLNYIDTIFFVPFRLERDVAILDVTPFVYEAVVGDTVDMDVIVENQGNFTESFTVNAFAQSLNSTRIYFDPFSYMFNSSAVSIGYRFNATLWVEDVADLYAWQVCIFYNDTIINVTRWFEPTWDPAYVFYGKPTLPVPTPPEVAYWHWGPGSGSAMVSTCLFGEQPTFTGSGLLFIMEFEITAIPPPGETLSCNLAIDNEDTFLLDSNIDYIPNVHKKNGYYELGPGVPPPPKGFYKIGTKTVTNLAPGERITLTFTWNTTGVIPGDYMIWAEASVVRGETDTGDNKYTDGIIKIIKPPFASFIYSPSFPKPGEAVTFNATSSTPNGGTIINYNWDFGDGNINATTDPIIIHTYAFSGLYNVTLTITDSEGLTDSTWKTIYIFIRDIAIVEVTPSTNRTYIGRTISITVTILNEGEVTETFDVSLYYNITAGDTIGTQMVIDLLPGEYRTLTFLWNTTGVKPSHNYTITAYALPVLGETDIADNILSSSTPVKVKLLGDINGDGKIDIRDIAMAAKAFGSYLGYPRWNPEADINQDGKIDMKDLATIAKNFGKTCL